MELAGVIDKDDMDCAIHRRPLLRMLLSDMEVICDAWNTLATRLVFEKFTAA